MTELETYNKPKPQIWAQIKAWLGKILKRLQQQWEQFVQSRREHKQALTEAQNLANDRASSGQCPRCGSNNLQAIHSVTQKGFNDTGACSGCCCLGPVGLLFGFCGSGKKQEQSGRMCLNCGNKF